MYLDLRERGLKTLVGYNFSENITGLNVSGNELTSLKGCPQSITSLNCSDNKLTSLKHCPKSVTNLDFSYNKIKTLKYLPSSINSLVCCYNKLTSLKGLKNKLEVLDCSGNDIKSLKYCPNINIMDCALNEITSFKYLPLISSYDELSSHLWCEGNPLHKKWNVIGSIMTGMNLKVDVSEKIYELLKLTRLTNYRNTFHNINQIKLFIFFKKLWENYWYDTYFKLNDVKVNRFCTFSVDNQ